MDIDEALRQDAAEWRNAMSDPPSDAASIAAIAQGARARTPLALRAGAVVAACSVVLVVALVVSVVTRSGKSSAPHRPVTAASNAPTACESRATLSRPAGSDSGPLVTPDGVISAVLCRYKATLTGVALPPVGPVELSQSEASQLVAALDQGESVYPGKQPCIEDNGAIDAISFQYADGHEESVIHSLSGCGLYSSEAASAWQAPRSAADLLDSLTEGK